jgi:WD40 repeat protein
MAQFELVPVVAEPLWHGGTINAVAVSPDDRLIATTTAGLTTCMVWQADTGRQLLVLPHDGVARHAVFLSARELATASGGQLHLWDLRTGLRTATLQHGAGLTLVAKVGSLLMGASSLLTLWTPRPSRRGGWEEAVRLAGHSRDVQCLSVSADGSLVVSASEDRTARVWSIPLRECSAVLVGHTGAVRHCELSPAGGVVATAANDHTARVWTLQGTCLATVLFFFDEYFKRNKQGDKKIRKKIKQTCK